jgi:methylaspartate ammonia-lyase
MRIKQVIFSQGRSGNYNKDFAALQTGPVADGAFYDAKPVTRGYRAIVQPGQCVCVILVLENGAVALGDCVDVILAGLGGRFPPFDPRDHFATFESEIRFFLDGLDVSSFAAADAAWIERAEGLGLHTALRYGISQALLHAASLAHARLMCEVIRDEFGFDGDIERIPLLIFCQRDSQIHIDHAIMKQADLFPHASFPDIDEHVGRQGEKLIAYVEAIARRIKDRGQEAYSPTIHVDTYGSIGRLFPEPAQLADYIARLGLATSPFKLMVESPIVAASRGEQVARFAALKECLRQISNAPRIIVDEWCNTLEDVRFFAEHDAADVIHIKLPDIGNIRHTIEGGIYCRQKGIGFALGGSANETDVSARVSAHIGLATKPAFMIGKPGLGLDEGLMIVDNEQNRAISIHRSWSRSPLVESDR